VTEGHVESGALSLKLVRRVQKFDQLPAAQQKTALQTIDVFLRSAGLEAKDAKVLRFDLLEC
jgi:hypothetical protein